MFDVEKVRADFPILAELDPMARTAGGDCGPAVTYDHLVMVYDTRNVQPAPTSLSAMWEPAHRGRLAISAPPKLGRAAISRGGPRGRGG